MYKLEEEFTVGITVKNVSGSPIEDVISAIKKDYEIYYTEVAPRDNGYTFVYLDVLHRIKDFDDGCAATWDSPAEGPYAYDWVERDDFLFDLHEAFKGWEPEHGWDEEDSYVEGGTEDDMADMFESYYRYLYE